MEKGADSQQTRVAIFRLAQTAGAALLAIYPDFEVFLRAHGVPAAARAFGEVLPGRSRLRMRVVLRHYFRPQWVGGRCPATGAVSRVEERAGLRAQGERMSVLDLMQEHEGEWFPVSIDDLASLAGTAEQVEIYRAALKQRFRILGSWQNRRLYTRFVWPSGKQKTVETRLAERVATTAELELPIE
jgi:hypothetical protein